MLRNHLETKQPSHGPEASCPDTTKQGDRTREPAPPTRGAYLRTKSQRTTYIILRRSHGQVTKVPGQAPHITTEHSADSRFRKPRARVCLHIQKPKPQATVKNKIEKIHKLFHVYNTIHKQWWGRAVAMAMLLPPPTKPNNPINNKPNNTNKPNQ